MGLKRQSVNLTLLILTILIAYALLDRLVLFTGLGGGISLTALAEDEFRIRFLPEPRSGQCKLNETHLQPRCSGTFRGNQVWLPAYKVNINSAGFRDREYHLEKGEDVFRIFVIGDSFTFGEGVNDDDNYPKVLERLLNEKRPDGMTNRTFEVFNLGMPGSSTDEAYRILIKYLGYNPDLVILQTLSNDPYECDLFLERHFPEYIAMLRQGRVDEADNWYQEIRDYAYGLPVIEKCSCVWYYLQELVNLTRELSAQFIVYDIQEYPASECFGPEEEDYIYIGTTFIWERRYLLSRADGHPSEDGHKKMAEELFPIILEAATRNGEVPASGGDTA